MTPKESEEVLGVSKSTYSDWKKQEHPKHNLYLIIKDLKYASTKKRITQLKEEEEKTS